VKTVRWVQGIILAGLCVGMTGCASFSVGSDKNPPQVKSEGLLSSYMAINGFRPYDGKILEAGLLSKNDRWGNVASLDIWPIGGIGVSLIGAKVKLLPFEIGLGVLGYEPKPEVYRKKKCEAAPEDTEDMAESKEELAQSANVRFEAATSIASLDKRDSALSRVAIDAAKTGQVDLAANAVNDIASVDLHDSTASECAMILCRMGEVMPALDMAKSIRSLDLRDKTLAGIATSDGAETRHEQPAEK